MTQAYSLKGQYYQGSTKGELNGCMVIGTKGAVKGSIIDLLNPKLRKTIEGTTAIKDGKRVFNIVMHIDDDNVLDLHYLFAKRGENVPGHYVGFYTPLDKILKVTGVHPLHSGDDAYEVEMKVPHYKDTKPQPAKITIHAA